MEDVFRFAAAYLLDGDPQVQKVVEEETPADHVEAFDSE